MRCKDCGREVNDASVFCPFCGHKQVDTHLVESVYEKKLKRFFVAKTILQFFLIIMLCVCLFAPIVKIEGESGSFFEIGVSSVKIFAALFDFISVGGEEGGEIVAFIAGIFVVLVFPFYLFVLIKLISSVFNSIGSLRALFDKFVLSSVTEEAGALKNGRFSKRQAVNYRKRRKIKGGTVFFLVLMFTEVFCLIGIEMICEVLTEFEFNIGSYGFIAAVGSSSDTAVDAMIGPMLFSMTVSFVSFIFSCIVYVFKTKTNFSALNKMK